MFMNSQQFSVPLKATRGHHQTNLISKTIAQSLLKNLSLSMRVSAFISLALVVVLVLHTVLYDIRLNMSTLPSIYTDHSFTLNICTRPFTIIAIHITLLHYY